MLGCLAASDVWLYVNVTEYVLFSFNIGVYYQFESSQQPSADYLIQMANSSHSLASVTLPPDVSQGHVMLPCDVIQSAGVHTVQLVDGKRGLNVLSQINFTAVWPTVRLSVNNAQFTVLQDDIVVSITRKTQYDYCIGLSIELCRLKHNTQTCSVRLPVLALSEATIIACSHLELPGVYFVRLVTSSSSVAIANSDKFELVTNSNQQYNIEPIWLDSVMSCTSESPVKVYFSKPSSNQCTANSHFRRNDKLRLYRKLAPSGRSAAANVLLNNLVRKTNLLLTYY